MTDRESDISRSLFRRNRACVVVPTYNNAATLADVIDGIRRYADDIIAVDDGSTDGTPQILASAQGVTAMRHPVNRGKGAALKTGFLKAREMGFRLAVTIDSDGQHYPSDLPRFIREAEAHPGALIVGSRGMSHDNMPGKSKFANSFSNFWFRLQTWRRLSDTQTGYRLYPLDKIGRCRLLTARYEAELELLVFAAWRGVELREIAVGVHYPPQEERVSHFRPAADFARISLLNTLLCFAAVVYGWPSLLLKRLTTP